MNESPDITGLLRDVSQGRKDALDRLIPLIYDEMRRIAHGKLRHEDEGHTLDTTALVHEAYLKLVDLREMQWQDRTHFYAVAARVMRRVLIDYARGRKRKKRGGDAVQIPLAEDLEASVERTEVLLEVDEALSRLETMNERQCRVVECRYFAGMSVEETAEALGISPATVKRDWAFSRAWLNRELAADSPDRQAKA